VNGSNDSLNLGYRRHQLQEEAYAATVAVDLSETLHVSSFHTLKDEKEFTDSKSKFDACESNLRKEKGNDGDVHFCFEHRFDINRTGRQLSVFEWQNADLVAVSDSRCYGNFYWNVDPSSKIGFSTCYEDLIFEREKKETSISLEVYKRPFDEKMYLFKGECEDITLWDMRLLSTSEIAFTLVTDCATIRVDDRPFQIHKPSDGGKLRAAYALIFDKNGFPTALKPL